MVESRFLAGLLASGGDGRIALRRGANTNQYGASPFPRSVRAYASSTANDISAPAFEHLCGTLAALAGDDLHCPDWYAATLDEVRNRIRASWDLPTTTEIAFAASGTDLEYLPLAIAAAKFARPITNILVGQDEVGSGCVLAARGRHFAEWTPHGTRVAKGSTLPGLESSRVVTIPIRNASGRALDAAFVEDSIATAARGAIAAGRAVVVHVVHGSKTGLVLPDLDAVDRLQATLADRALFVVDACQARSTSETLAAYIRRGCAVMVTGSKFIGGPPFSGFVFLPECFQGEGNLAPGLARVFKRAELPCPLAERCFLPQEANPGLAMRLLAAQFEVERFGAVDARARNAVIQQFGIAVRGLANGIGARLVSPSLESDALHQSTLATLDLSVLPSGPDFALAQRWHRVLAARGLRLGQPVKCVRLPGDRWGGTLRISLSMPLIVEFSALSPAELAVRLDDDMTRIADVIGSAERPIVA